MRRTAGNRPGAGGAAKSLRWKTPATASAIATSTAKTTANGTPVVPAPRNPAEVREPTMTPRLATQ